MVATGGAGSRRPCWPARLGRPPNRQPTILPRLFDVAWAIHGGDDGFLDDLVRLARLAGRLPQAAALNARVATRARLSLLRAHALALLAITEGLPDDTPLLLDAWV